MNVENTLINNSINVQKDESNSLMSNSEDQFRTMIDLSPSLIFVHQDDRIVFANKKAISGLCGEQGNLIGMSFNDFLSSGFQASFVEIELNEPTEYKLVSLDGKEIYLETVVTQVTFNSKPAFMIVGHDITKNKKRDQEETSKQCELDLNNSIENEQLAFQDYLTGLPNRNRLISHLAYELNHSVQKDQSFALLFIDLDRFKNINDSLGHDVGDQLLKEVAERLKSCISRKDVIFRQGGDEFIVVLSNTDRNLATKVAKYILNTLSHPFTINSYDIFTTPSIGISVFPENGETVETLIKHADYAMYQAKQAGKNNFKFYSDYTCSEDEVGPLLMEMELHRALERQQLTLYYQPKVNLKTGKIVGVEALLRWIHPELGFIYPETFIPIAEETGLIIPIGEWVLTAACQQNKMWQQQGFSTIISVNLSARQFSQVDILTTIKTVLSETNLEPHYLELEITESMAADNEYAIHTLLELKKLGVRISIDDFGAGFSSLNRLKKIPLDTLKIDQTFIDNIRNSINDRTIIKTLISMAHNLNLNVVAEGIETKSQLMFLQKNYCDTGQGYLFSRPVTADQLLENYSDIQNSVKLFGLPQERNQLNWAKELLRRAKNELNETIRLQQGMIFKYKLIKGHFIHTLCDGELVYRINLTPSQIVGKELHDFLSKEIAEEKLQYYKRAWDGEENITYENEHNGIYYLCALSPVIRGGKVVEVIGSGVDITDRKHMEKELQKSQEKYRLIAENMTDLIGIFDVNSRFLYASPSHQTVLGYTPESFIGTSILECIHADDVKPFKTFFEEMLETKAAAKFEIRTFHKNGACLLLECFGNPVIEDNGEVERVIMVGRDITEKRRAEEQLMKAEKLQVVGELAAGVAHEIRNPLTAIKGFVQLFQVGQIKDDYFNVIFSEFERIEEIINEFLSLAKPKEIKQSYTSIPQLYKEVETLFESEANLKNIQFSKKITEDVQPIMCDRNQIKQVLINVIKNSIESIESGGLIKAKICAKEEYLVIKISDNGVGISEERLQKLGEPFYSNKEKGTGLGLMMCYKIIEEHNGTISFKSQVNKGTTVKIKLPLGQEV
ncbi:EAL domain-containing protein [Bacillus sp. Marseille-P3661]|uniref:EAL domain-containing protein n=1 Tax=Bacillus sp. Marseille-P3661 TaxID=1936234 RepID=UPI000C85488C|nr:EAL domain-containing protein [Bacillus sp. Marseille-P3661]